jgi:hypothetical protein
MARRKFKGIVVRKLNLQGLNEKGLNCKELPTAGGPVCKSKDRRDFLAKLPGFYWFDPYGLGLGQI